jgi:predicted DNA-binding transcriptional regulator AlpA
MDIEQSLLNVLDVSNLDFNFIGENIEKNFGSIEAYNDYLNNLVNNFEKTIAINAIDKPKEQLEAFLRHNFLIVHNAINSINLIEDGFNKNRKLIESEQANIDLIDNLYLPVYNLHKEKLIYLKHIIKNMFPHVDTNSTYSDVKKEVEIVENNKSKELLDDYPDLLKMSEVEGILKVKRNAIYNYEKEGYFKRCSLKNKTVLFNKEDIKKFIQNR